MKTLFALAAILLSAQRAVEGKICNYGGYCLSNYDCFDGSNCVKQNQFYSQCVPPTGNTCVVDYQQCGGLSKAPYCCASSTCVVQNAYYSQCIPNICTYPSGFATQSVVPSGVPSSVKPVMSPSTNPSFRQSSVPSENPIAAPSVNPSNVPSISPSQSPSSTPTTVPSADPVVKPSTTPVMTPSNIPTTTPTIKLSKAPYSAQLICQYSGYCRTSADCVHGNKCNVQSAYYSQCIPDSASYLTANCIANHANRCSDSTQCCDPGAYCNNANFRQCQQPPQNSAWCASPTGFVSPSSNPVQKPSTEPSTVKSPSPTANPVPVPSDSPVSSRPTKSPVSYAGLICQYSGYCRTSADCVPGNKCNVQSAYYSQCIPDSASYLTTNCIANYANQCSDSTQCCDPGAYCNNANFRQCQQPPQNSAMCLTLYSYPADSTSPTKSPSGAPSVKPTSLVPSAVPSTSFPTAAAPLTISYTVNQTLSNVTCQAFNTDPAKTAFIATVAQTLNILPTSVNLVTVVCNNGGRRRLAAASGPSVTIIYFVSYKTVKSVEEDRSILTGAVTSGAFTSALRVNAASAGATALLSASSTSVSVVDKTSTATPSADPSTTPSTTPSTKPTVRPSEVPTAMTSTMPSAVASDAPQGNPTAHSSEAPTGAPMTMAPVTGAPMTMAPMTDAPMTMAPMTDAPMTMAPVTGAPM